MDVPINCICPPKADGAPRHTADTVTLPDTLDFRTTLTVRHTIASEMGSGDATKHSIIALLIETYLIHCISAWTLVDEKGKPVPLTRQNVRDLLLVHDDEAMVVGDAADELYTDKVILPLMKGASDSSSGSPMPTSMSPTNGRGTKRPTRSKRSSTSTSPMVVTGPMAASPGGGSSFSQS